MIRLFPRLLFLTWSGALAGGPVLTDPGIANGEQSVYASECGGIREKITETVSLQTVEGKEVYADTFRSAELDRYITVEKSTLRVLSTHTVRHGAEAEVETIQIVREKKPKQKTDEVRISDFYGLRFLLRGYPFQNPRTIRINVLNGQDEVTMVAKYAGEESLEVQGKTMECVKLELGFAGMVGIFLSDSQLWYQKAPPHALVSFQGNSEFNRKVRCRIKLDSYRPGR
jgi:hypothetical protein